MSPSEARPKIGRKIGGWALILAGLAGCVLPILPGIPLLLGGLAMLATEYAWARMALERLKGYIARVRGKRPQGSAGVS